MDTALAPTAAPSSTPHAVSAETSSAMQSQQSGQTQFLRMALGQEMYTVRIDRVREILEVSRMTPLPLMPSFVRGVMNLRGAVVPVIDLSARLGMPPATLARRSCIVMVDVRGSTAGEPGPTHTLGMLVDAVFEVFEAGSREQEPVPRLGTRIDPAHIRCMVRLRGQPTPELNLDTLLDLKELTEMIAAHSARH